MKVSRFVLFLAVTLLAVPVMAQDRAIDVSVFATWVDPSGENVIEVDDGDDVEVEFDSEIGFGLAVNVFWGNTISTEFAAAMVEPEFTATDPTLGPFLAAGLEMIPITAILQFHFNPEGRFDPYIGAGVGYVLFDDIDDEEDLRDTGIDEIEFDEDFGWAVNLGAHVGFTDNFGLYLDAKYIGVGTEATAVVGDEAFPTDLDVDPLMLSAGVTFRF
jgi:outer membrane protein